MQLIEIRLTVTIENETLPGDAAEQVFDLVAADPDDLAPLVQTVDGVEWSTVNE